jgi:predicted DNA-binding transcriptional regulator AlpA
MASEDGAIVDRLLRPGEAAEALGFALKTLESWRASGEGPRFVRIGRAVRYRSRDLEDFVEARIARSTADPGAAR